MSSYLIFAHPLTIEEIDFINKFIHLFIWEEN